VALGRRVLRAYIVVFYERGPLYFHFDSYRASGNWIVVAFLFNTKPELILPPELLR